MSDALSGALDNFTAILGDSATWQALVQTGGNVVATDTSFTTAVAAVQADRSTYRTAAQAAIHKWWMLPSHTLPRVNLRFERDTHHQEGRRSWKGESVISVYFELNTPTALKGLNNYSAAGEDFADKIGAIRRELMELSGTGTAPSPGAANTTYMNLIDVSLQDIGQPDPDDNNALDFWAAFFYVGWNSQIQLQA